ncbi:hypothetical protein DSO57_1021895 [Entomophthora muscae]|uniref:Uncharacterized protein n=1 Tax=Entomophthora muscae TaxID=34485 RepID=A0ACC2T3F3_9FUNG|nr:hypothetical protein DSO57_1021895 [Entomophthora muscae]
MEKYWKLALLSVVYTRVAHHVLNSTRLAIPERPHFDSTIILDQVPIKAVEATPLAPQDSPEFAQVIPSQLPLVTIQPPSLTSEASTSATQVPQNSLQAQSAALLPQAPVPLDSGAASSQIPLPFASPAAPLQQPIPLITPATSPQQPFPLPSPATSSQLTLSPIAPAGSLQVPLPFIAPTTSLQQPLPFASPAASPQAPITLASPAASPQAPIPLASPTFPPPANGLVYPVNPSPPSPLPAPIPSPVLIPALSPDNLFINAAPSPTTTTAVTSSSQIFPNFLPPPNSPLTYTTTTFIANDVLFPSAQVLPTQSPAWAPNSQSNYLDAQVPPKPVSPAGQIPTPYPIIPTTPPEATISLIPKSTGNPTYSAYFSMLFSTIPAQRSPMTLSYVPTTSTTQASASTGVSSLSSEQSSVSVKEYKSIYKNSLISKRPPVTLLNDNIPSNQSILLSYDGLLSMLVIILVLS